MNPSFFTQHGLPAPVPEFQFHKDRKWRFDFAFVDQKIALEIDGGAWVGGRHTSPKGYFLDMEKFNEAAIAGWRVLRITPKADGTLIAVDLVRRAMRS